MQKEAIKFADSNILEGMTSIRALINGRKAGTNDRPVKAILYDKEKAAAKAKELAYLNALRPQFGYEMRPADKEEIESLTIGSTHGGIIALCGERTLPALDRLAAEMRPDGFYVMIEGIEDPYNFGYALRALYAAGVDGIVLPPRNWMGVAGVVARASAGASELFSMYIGEPTQAAGLFRAKGYQIVCADRRNARPLHAVRLRRPLFLVVGGEKRGISRALLDMADLSVKIEYGRPFAASLSAASAAAILAYEIFRQSIADSE